MFDNRIYKKFILNMIERKIKNKNLYSTNGKNYCNEIYIFKLEK